MRPGPEREAREWGPSSVILTGRVDTSRPSDLLALRDVHSLDLATTGICCPVVPSKVFEDSAMVRPVVLGLAGFVAEPGAGSCIEPDNERERVCARVRVGP